MSQKGSLWDFWSGRSPPQWALDMEKRLKDYTLDQILNSERRVIAFLSARFSEAERHQTLMEVRLLERMHLEADRVRADIQDLREWLVAHRVRLNLTSYKPVEKEPLK